MQRRPVAVIGGTGFIGSRLVAALAAPGRPVSTFSRAVPAVAGGRAAPGLRRADTVYFLATGLNPVLAEQRPDRVAAEAELFAEVLGTLAAEGRRPVVVLTSSGGAVYAPEAPPPYSEVSPTRPTSAYGLAKVRLEQELLLWDGGIRPLVVRLSNVFGPGQHLTRGYGVLTNWLVSVARNEPVRLFGDPGTGRDYIYVDDVAAVLAAVHRRVESGTVDALPAVLNVGSGAPTSLADLLDVVRMVIGREVMAVVEEPRPFDRPTNWLDTGLVRTTLGWEPVTDLLAGVRRCWQHTVGAGGRATPQGRESAHR